MTPSTMVSVVGTFESKKSKYISLKPTRIYNVCWSVREYGIIHGMMTPRNRNAIMFIFSANPCHLDPPPNDFITFNPQLFHKRSKCLGSIC